MQVREQVRGETHQRESSVQSFVKASYKKAQKAQNRLKLV